MVGLWRYIRYRTPCTAVLLELRGSCVREVECCGMLCKHRAVWGLVLFFLRFRGLGFLRDTSN